MVNGSHDIIAKYISYSYTELFHFKRPINPKKVVNKLQVCPLALIVILSRHPVVRSEATERLKGQGSI